MGIRKHITVGTLLGGSPGADLSPLDLQRRSGSSSPSSSAGDVFMGSAAIASNARDDRAQPVTLLDSLKLIESGLNASIDEELYY